jgi:hypothetical protein
MPGRGLRARAARWPWWRCQAERHPTCKPRGPRFVLTLCSRERMRSVARNAVA